MGGHFIERCKSCERVVGQCRCMDCNKELRWTTEPCDRCSKVERLSPAEKAAKESACPDCILLYDELLNVKAENKNLKKKIEKIMETIKNF